ncbi:MAG TPA: hypothetical protein VH352_28435 [Pseudonocardiaceae bacterium]|jgi:hypothetical protein|nr:hypothetical protein [Pseudonocardiaceae bacterium]
MARQQLLRTPTDLPLEWAWSGRRAVSGTGRLVIWDLHLGSAALPAWRMVESEAHEVAFTRTVGRRPTRRVYQGALADPLVALDMLLVNGIDRARAVRLLPTYLPALATAFETLWPSGFRQSNPTTVRLRAAAARLAVTPGTTQSFVTPELRAIVRRKLICTGLADLLDPELGACGSDHVDPTARLDIAVRRAGARHGVHYSARDVVVLDGTTLQPADRDRDMIERMLPIVA